MSETVNLELPLIAASQSQKHVTHNEALAIADALVHLAVISRALASPPASPLDGDRYLIAGGATGLWSTHEGALAFYLDGVWRFATPRIGWRLWSAAEEKYFVFDGSLWRDIQDIDELQDMELLGVNTTADAANRLAVASANVLFTHEGGDQRIKINKHAAADTASFLFQTNYSGRAEIGTAGDDDFHFKVSPDGAAWTAAIVIDKDDGQAKFVAGSASAPGVAIGGTTSGLFLSTSLRFTVGGVESFRCDANGIGIGDDPTSNICFRSRKAGGGQNSMEIAGEGTCSYIATRYSNDTGGPQNQVRKGRGTIAAPMAVAQNDTVQAYDLRMVDDTLAFRQCAFQTATMRAASPSSTSFETRMSMSIVPAGSGTPSEFWRQEHATGLSMFGANVVINQNRHFRKRQYAAASLPAQNSGDEIASSDIVAATLVSDGTEWLSPGAKRLRAVTANTSVSIPAGWAIDRIFYAETAGNAVSGGIRIGTTSGAADVVAAQAVGANALDVTADASILKKVFSRSAAQTLFIQAVTSWNSASVELSFVLRKVF